MAQESHDDQKAQSPSKLIQRGVDQSWGRQQDNTTDATEALKNKDNTKQVTP